MSLTDYAALQHLVETALPRLDFRNPDHALAGHELLAMLNRVGALLEYQRCRRQAVPGSSREVIMYKSKSEMAHDLGLATGRGCWCGHMAPTGSVHLKVWHPVSCGSTECEKLQEKYDGLPDDGNWEGIFA